MNVKKYNGNKWYYDFDHEGRRYKKKGFKTKREATEAETIAKNQLMRGIVINNKTSFIDYYEQWIEVNKKNVITDRAYLTYVNAIKQFKKFLATENLDDITLSNFSTTLYRKFIKWYGADHATESVKKLHNCIKASLMDAIQEGLIYKDPTYKAVIKGKKASQPEEDKFMNLEDYKKLKSYVANVPIQSYLLIYILVITGGRFGEAQKLTTDDINYLKNTIHLRGTKTETSDRIVDIPSEDMKVLRNTLSEMLINMNKQIFNTGYSLITNNAVTKVLQKFCLENRLGNFTLHAIKHTHCSYLLHGRVSIYYISKRLGHASIKTTLDVYSHLLDEANKIESEKALKLIKSM
ncbi:MAG: tyrosine-type recombinase/integrase [Staphylococcus rostri]|uniref:tyrosine-type recombinase/integrase n=1 Tax=Staphylococcus rostri TaxID=522262 RepID=UPI0026DEC443|nr:tyrosine-type recombinase/integrase [Staphylococcus rostri]MDO5374966.1 tyrosine-type recombinase/integrase [Staphylococcus rostri]